jgi:hypothetical protein
MVLTLLSGNYPEFIGRRSAFVGVGKGPATYTTGTADPVTVNLTPYYIDVLFGGVLDTTGTYIAVAVPKGTGVRQSWGLRYNVASTGAEYAGGAALSGLSFQIGGLGGQF